MSTDKQRALSDYTHASGEGGEEAGEDRDAHSGPVSAPDWIAGQGGEDDGEDNVNHRHCKNCKGHVTAEFARVSGDNDNVVYRCPNCANASELAHGAAGIEDFEHRVKGGLYQ